MVTKKILLPESENPKQWYNIVADMPTKPLPPLNPQTRKPMTVDDLSVVFAHELAKQELSTERYIDIPEEVQDIFRIWRNTPLVRAHGLERMLQTPAKI